MVPRSYRNYVVWLTQKQDGWWYCYEEVVRAGPATDFFGPFGSEQLAWGDAQRRIEGGPGRRSVENRCMR